MHRHAEAGDVDLAEAEEQVSAAFSCKARVSADLVTPTGLEPVFSP